MKKQLALLTMLLVLCLALMACTPSPGSTATPNITPDGVTNAPDATQTPTDTPPTAPSDEPSDTPTPEDVQKDVESMMPILDSLVATMGTGGATPYAPTDPEFFWTFLYLIGNNWGSQNPLITMEEDGTHIVPKQLMQEFASAAFIDYDDLLAVPESLAHVAQYDEDLDAYRLAPSDRGDSSTRFESVDILEDGSIIARVGLYTGPDELLGMLDFTLVENPYAASISDPVYLYSVSAASAAAAS